MHQWHPSLPSVLTTPLDVTNVLVDDNEVFRFRHFPYSNFWPSLEGFCDFKGEIPHQISRDKRWRTEANDVNIAQFYGLPEIHKWGIPLRPILHYRERQQATWPKAYGGKRIPSSQNMIIQSKNALPPLEKYHRTNIEVNGTTIPFEVMSSFHIITLRYNKADTTITFRRTPVGTNN